MKPMTPASFRLLAMCWLFGGIIVAHFYDKPIMPFLIAAAVLHALEELARIRDAIRERQR